MFEHVLRYSCERGGGLAKQYTSREILRLLRKDGWEIKCQAGSHVQLVHPAKPGKVTVPHPKRSLPAKTVASILKQAGLRED